MQSTDLFTKEWNQFDVYNQIIQSGNFLTKSGSNKTVNARENAITLTKYYT